MSRPQLSSEGLLDRTEVRRSDGPLTDGAVALSHACEPAPSADVSGTPASTGAGAGGRPRSRLIGIDAARGIALVGMMGVHIFEPADSDGTMSLAWTLAGGKSAALFALLAGVGIAFTSGRRPPHGVAWRANAAALVVRALLIGTVGLLLGYVVPGSFAAVILPYYALLFVLAIPLLSLSVRWLIGLAGLIAVAVPILSHLLRAHLPTAPEYNPTFSDVWHRPLELLRELALTGVYPALAWMAYLCAGLAVGRTVLTSRRTVARIGLIGLALVFASMAVSWLLLDVLGGRVRLETVALRSMSADEFKDIITWGPTGVTPTDTGWWLATRLPHSSTPPDLLFTIGVALAVLAACILLGRATTAVLRPLAAPGSMTLTLYSLHLLMLSSPFDPENDLTSFLIQVLVVVTFALVWSRYHTRGPLEAVVARATGAVRSRVMTAGSGKGVGGRHRR
jgi:uncharacterized membrane protein